MEFKLGLVSVCTVILQSVICGCSHPEAAEPAVVHQRVLEKLEASEQVNVIVNFKDPEPDAMFRDKPGHRELIRRAREAMIVGVPAGLTTTRHFAHVPAVAGRVTRAALEALSHDPSVSSIQIDSPGQGALKVSVSAIGADVAQRDYHVTGKGVRVAVLDTGINTRHPDLTSSIFPTQHCFTQNDCPPHGTREGTSAEDDHGHGSHVSGIITSDGTLAGIGFAPGAEIIPVKIDDYNDAGMESDWVAGLDWVFENLDTLKVKIINMSICTNALYGSASECDAGEPALAHAIKNLVDAGVTIFAASGNLGSSSQLAAPACNTGVVAVGATYKSDQGRQPTSGTYESNNWNGFGDCADSSSRFDQVACFTNSGPRLDLVAPGAIIESDSLGTRTEQYRGTSQASPTAAGVAALLLECNPSLGPSEIKDILSRTAVTVVDPKNGRSYPSIRAAAAVKEACDRSVSNPGTGGAGLGGAGGSASTNMGETAGSDNRGGASPGGLGGAVGSVPGAGGSSGATNGPVGAGVGGTTTGDVGVPSGGSANRGDGQGTPGAGGSTPGCSLRAGAQPGSGSGALFGFGALLGLTLLRLSGARRSETREGDDDTSLANMRAFRAQGAANDCLVVLFQKAGAAGLRFKLSGATIDIGRSFDNHLVLEDKNISRHHCRLERRGGRFFITDLGTKNGTLLNESGLNRTRALKTGDIIQLGSTILKYLSAADPEAVLYEQLYLSTVTDALTGLKNKRYLEEELAREFSRARRRARPLSVLMIDIDFFKRINDQHGHLVGDSALQVVAARVLSCVRAEDAVARFGGEEIVVILGDASLKVAASTAERIRAAVAAEPVLARHARLNVTVSIGCAELLASDVDERSLLARADARVYSAKSAGRNVVRC